MKLSSLLFLVGLLQFLSHFEVACDCNVEDEFPPRNYDQIEVNEPFTLSLKTFTDQDVVFEWSYEYEGIVNTIDASNSSDLFIITEEVGPAVGSCEWRNSTLSGVFPTSGDKLISCTTNIKELDSSTRIQVNALTSATSNPSDDSNFNPNKNPPRASSLILSSPAQGSVKLNWRVFPHNGPHCLTYFNVTYKSWDASSQDQRSLEWIFETRIDLNIVSGVAGTYSYTLDHQPLGNTVKFRIVSYCSNNDTTKDKTSKELVVQEHIAPEIYGLPLSRNVSEGERVDIVCNARGYPQPAIEWTTKFNTSYQVENILRFDSVSETDAGVYTCKASSSPNRTLLSDERQIILNVNINPSLVPVATGCAIATLNDCSPFLNDSSGNYLLSAEIDRMAFALNNYLLDLTGTSVYNPCYRGGMTYFCNTLFRPCIPNEDPLRVVSPQDDYCKKDCDDFWESNICQEFWREFTVSDIYRGYSWVRECTEITSTPETCLPLGIERILSLDPITTPEGVTVTTQPTDSTTLPLIITIVIIFVVILVIFVCIVIFCVMYYKQINKPQLCSSKFTESKVAENQFYLPFNTKTTLTDRKEFPRSAVRFLRKLGQGQFGSVDLAEASTIIPGEKVTLVAVKTLHDGATTKNRMDFEREAEIMLRFDHPNILQLLGVSFKDKTAPLCLIFEYMEKGDLNNYLRGCASSYIKRFNNVPCPARSRTESQLSDDPPVLSANDLVNISTQIASGMHYLAVRSFVHRDLATRNCLVGKNLVVKIGDFGMSKDVYKSDYYRIGKEALLPIKWMAPEAIMYGKATIQTDIWSFGVLMWEVFSFAMQPWYGFTNEQVIEKVKGGEILSKPDNCPQLIYSLMLECWDMDPVKRISFESILQRLASWRMSSTESTSLQDVTMDASDPFDHVCTS